MRTEKTKTTCRWNPFNKFPSNVRRKIYEETPLDKIVDELESFKTLPRGMLSNEESERDELTYRLFTLVAEGKLKQNDFNKIREVIPSRYKREFLRLSIIHNFGIEEHGIFLRDQCRFWGEDHEAEIIQSILAHSQNGRQNGT